MSNPHPQNAFKPGNKVAEGNDKTARLSTFIRKKLRTSRTLKEYEEARLEAQLISDDYVDSYWKAKTIKEKKEIFESLRDTDEGKPAQSVKLSGDSENPIGLVIYRPEKYSDPDESNN